MSTAPIENLERRAFEQRRDLHDTVNVLRSRIRIAREKLDVRNQAREHFGAAALVVSAIGFLWGYFVAGAFTKR